jgi:hypothetical protein
MLLIGLATLALGSVRDNLEMRSSVPTPRSDSDLNVGSGRGTSLDGPEAKSKLMAVAFTPNLETVPQMAAKKPLRLEGEDGPKWQTVAIQMRGGPADPTGFDIKGIRLFITPAEALPLMQRLATEQRLQVKQHLGPCVTDKIEALKARRKPSPLRCGQTDPMRCQMAFLPSFALVTT